MCRLTCNCPNKKDSKWIIKLLASVYRGTKGTCGLLIFSRGRPIKRKNSWPEADTKLMAWPFFASVERNYQFLINEIVGCSNTRRTSEFETAIAGSKLLAGLFVVNSHVPSVKHFMLPMKRIHICVLFRPRSALLARVFYLKN